MTIIKGRAKDVDGNATLAAAGAALETDDSLYAHYALWSTPFSMAGGVRFRRAGKGYVSS
jgi:hypothetical protein